MTASRVLDGGLDFQMISNKRFHPARRDQYQTWRRHRSEHQRRGRPRLFGLGIGPRQAGHNLIGHRISSRKKRAVPVLKRSSEAGSYGGGVAFAPGGCPPTGGGVGGVGGMLSGGWGVALGAGGCFFLCHFQPLPRRLLQARHRIRSGPLSLNVLLRGSRWSAVRSRLGCGSTR